MSLIERAVGHLGSGGDRNAHRGSARRDPASKDIAGASVRHGVAQAPGNPERRLTIDLKRLARRGYVIPDGKQHLTAQEFRVIKRPLLANALDQGPAPVENGRRIMVTSSVPGEGKTFCAINLAMSFAAERDIRTLLVDADVARPKILKELGVESRPGLMDWLVSDKFDLDDLVLPTSIDKLDVLPAGRRNRNATELLASAAMSRLLDEISQRYPEHVVIFDSPPLLVTTEARVLASYMGQVVMVVAAMSTPQEAVRDALDMVDENEVVGMVLNKSKAHQSGNGYGYGYGHIGR
ncbi:MAG: XrtA-associated tyrosine autokinase [Burkholderiaceae bacterium]